MEKIRYTEVLLIINNDEFLPIKSELLGLNWINMGHSGNEPMETLIYAGTIIENDEEDLIKNLSKIDFKRKEAVTLLMKQHHQGIFCHIKLNQHFSCLRTFCNCEGS